MTETVTVSVPASTASAGNTLALNDTATRDIKRHFREVGARAMLREQFGFTQDENGNWPNPVAAELYHGLTVEQSNDEVAAIMDTQKRNLEELLAYEQTHPEDMQSMIQQSQAQGIPCASPSAIQNSWDTFAQLRDLQANLPSLPSAEMQEGELFRAIELWEGLFENMRPGAAAIPGMNFMFGHLSNQFDKKKIELADSFRRYRAMKTISEQQQGGTSS